MIRGLIFLALWAALPSPGQVGSAALYTEFEHKPTPAVVEALRDEVASLMSPNGLRFEWKSLPSNGQSAWTELAIVKFSGRCEVLPFATNSHSDRRLGWTHMSDGVVLPFAEVDCDAIQAYLLKDMALLLAPSREKVFGRAIGRVVTHELLHIFAQTAAHSDHGVDHPTLTVSELMADRSDLGEHLPPAHILHASEAPELQTGEGSLQTGESSYVRAGCANCHGGRGEGTPHAPALRVAGRVLNSVTLAAKLAKNQDTMWQRARSLKVATPSVAEDELSGLVRYLNEIEQ
jgi:cytochrome c553